MLNENQKKLESAFSRFPISPELLKSIKKNGFVKPTPIQVRSFRASLLLDKHILGAAQTGSGKTLAYAIPVIERILKNKESPCSILKSQLCHLHRKGEDFDLMEGDIEEIEDMIVDRDLECADGSDTPVESEVESEEEQQDKSESEQNTSCPEAVILVPTRELAIQVKGEFEKLCSGTKLKSITLIGGLSLDKQIRLLKKLKPEIVIATPGRLYDLVQSDNVKHLNSQSLASIRTLVIDEADRMVEKGHFKELTSVLEIVNASKNLRSAKFELRVYLFSATLTFLHELPDRLKSGQQNLKDSKSGKKSSQPKASTDQHSKKNKINKMLTLLGIEKSDTKIIDLSDRSNYGRPSSEQLEEMKINCLANEKDLYLYYFLMNNPNRRTLVFCNSKDCLRRLSNVLKYLKINTLKLHAEMDQKKRMSSLERFRKNENLVMLATDVAARGLDVTDLECVIHYQVPRTCESYIHRSGRTARLDKNGISLTLCEPKEAPLYRRLCNNINAGRDLLDYEVDIKLRALLHSRVVLAQQCDKLDHHLREKKSATNWFIKAAQECDIELDQDDFRRLGGKGKSKEENLEEDAKNRRKLSAIQKQLNSLLRRPLVTREALIKEKMQKLQPAPDETSLDNEN